MAINYNFTNFSRDTKDIASTCTNLNWIPHPIVKTTMESRERKACTPPLSKIFGRKEEPRGASRKGASTRNLVQRMFIRTWGQLGCNQLHESIYPQQTAKVEKKGDKVKVSWFWPVMYYFVAVPRGMEGLSGGEWFYWVKSFTLTCPGFLLLKNRQ